MHKERLFKYIRNEEVVIWAGAGLSLYAGYPSGQGLVDLIYKDLTSEEKKIINPNLSLQTVTEELIRIRKSKNSLNALLEKIFVDFSPISTEYHDKLTTIPHIRTIVTTNYDSLFEDAFKNNCNTIRNSQDLTYQLKNKVDIIKIHGDLTNRDNIIISQSDYNDFFKNNLHANPIWTHIRNLIATKNILFLGYGYEDPNISVVFDKILDEFGEHRKEIFFVAPNQYEHKVDYLKSKNIHYIDLHGEKFIDELIEDIKSNIIEDFEKNMVSPDTLNSFLVNYNLSPDLIGKGKSYKLKSINTLKKDIGNNFNIALTANKVPDEFKDLLEGKKFGEFDISQEQITDFSFLAQGIKLLSHENLDRIKFSSTPKLVSKVDLRFIDGFEINAVDVKIFASKYKTQIHSIFKCGEIIVDIDSNFVNDQTLVVQMKYEHNKICTSIKDEIEFFNFLKRFADGMEFTIFGTDLNIEKQQLLKTDSNLLTVSTQMLLLFQNLKTIEKYYNIQFKNFDIVSIDNKTYSLILNIVKLIINGKLVESWDDTFVISDCSKNDGIEKVIDGSCPLEIHYTDEKVFVLNQEISLGKKIVKILSPEITNLNELNREKPIIKSKVNQIEIHFVNS